MLIDIMETGDYQVDHAAGQRVAELFVRQLKDCDLTPFYLADMAELFSERFGPVERGFLSGLSYALIDI